MNDAAAGARAPSAPGNAALRYDDMPSVLPPVDVQRPALAAVPRAAASDRARFVRECIRRRRSRDRLFGADVFADPVRDMLLDLYAAHYEQQNVSVSSLCITAAVPATTALRSARIMVERGWAIRTRNRHDARRIHVRLSDEAREKLDLYFADAGSAIAAES